MCISFLRKKSDQRGQSLVELAAGLMIVIPCILVCIDLSTLYMGVQLNDTVCRDAARAASVGAPDGITSGEPLRRAQGVVSRANATAGAVQLDPTSVAVTESFSSALPTAPYGGPVNGQVTVTTTVKVWPPFLLSLLSQGQAQTFTTNKTFSYTWSMPATTTLTPPQGAGQTL